MQQTINKISLVGAGVGLVMIIISIIQWFFLYPDISQFLFGVGLGCNIMIFSYIYNWMKNKDVEIDGLGRATDVYRRETWDKFDKIDKIIK